MAGLLASLLPNIVKGVGDFAGSLSKGENFGQALGKGLSSVVGMAPVQQAADMLPNEASLAAARELPQVQIPVQMDRMGTPSLETKVVGIEEPKKSDESPKVKQKGSYEDIDPIFADLETTRAPSQRKLTRIDHLIEGVLDRLEDMGRAPAVDWAESLIDKAEGMDKNVEYAMKSRIYSELKRQSETN